MGTVVFKPYVLCGLFMGVSIVNLSADEIDHLSPTVSVVTTTPDQTRGASCQHDYSSVHGISLLFKDKNPDLSQLTNQNNYRFIHTGPDTELNSSSCTTLSGDDRFVSLLNLSLSSSENHPIVRFDLPALTDGYYALMVCDEITDLAGNALDGNGDGIPGGHFIQPFRISQNNLFHNAYLDHCDTSRVSLHPWFAFGDNNSQHLVLSTPDAQNSTLSGSLLMNNGAGLSSGVSQCIELQASRSYLFSVKARTTQNHNVPLSLSCQFSPAAGCASFGATLQRQYLVNSTVTEWNTYAFQHTAPDQARSAMCSIEIGSQQYATVYLDDVSYVSTTQGATEYIFSHSFD